MMAGNPNWWNMHPHESHSQFSDSSLSNSTMASAHHHHQDFPVRSWSQLLLCGLAGGEEEAERFGGSLFEEDDQKRMENNWEREQILNLNPFFTRIPMVDVKQEVSQSIYDNHDHEFQTNNTSNSWPHHHHHETISVSSPTSNTFLNFSGSKAVAAAVVVEEGKNHQHNQDHSYECNSTSSGGVLKKARVQHSSPQPALKVRKEKLGDRITALHQLVSPFGKTDTASVLSEAIGYIRFLQGQIEALSSPYMRNGSINTSNHQHSSVERNCLFQEEAGQFSNDMGVEGRGAPKRDSHSHGANDLRSRGLCLVPISCTENVGNDNGADYWAPAALDRGF